MILGPLEIPLEIKIHYETLGYELIEIINDKSVSCQAYIKAHKKDSEVIIGWIGFFSQKKYYYIGARSFPEETMLRLLKLKAFL